MTKRFRTHRYRLAVLAGITALASGSAALSTPAAPPPAEKQVASTGPVTKPLLDADGTKDETPKPQPIEQGDSVAAIVNDTAISTLDVNQRVKLFLVTAGVRPDEAQIARLRGEILKQLETERIQLLEAQKHNITVSAGEVDKAIQNILDENHIDKAKLEATFEAAGVHMTTLRGQIAAQIAWSKTVQARYGDEAVVSPSQVNSEMARLKEHSDQPRYRVSEIFMSVDHEADAPKVKKAMEDVLAQLRSGAPFPNVARTVSQNPTAAEGGDLGYVTASQMPPELEKALIEMKTGQVSEPIRGPGGYYILALREEQVPVGSKLAERKPEKSAYPAGTLPLGRILLPIGAKPPPQLVQQAFKAAEVLRSHIEDCKALPDLVKHMPGAIYMDLGVMQLSSLSKEIQSALAKTTPGEPAEPFQSPAGIEIIVRCDKAPPKIVTYSVPNRQQVENQLYEEQMSVLARRYMRDLRRDADIETR